MGNQNGKNSKPGKVPDRTPDEGGRSSQMYIEATEARSQGQFKEASALFEATAEASANSFDPPGITASYYYEAANCAERARRNEMRNTSRKRTSENGNMLMSESRDARLLADVNPSVESVAVSKSRSFEDPEINRESMLLRKSVLYFEKAQRWSKAAEVQKRIAFLNQYELNHPVKAAVFYDLAARNFEQANFFNNSVDCDHRRAEILYETEPLEALNIYKSLVTRMAIRDQQISAKPIMFKVVMLTASVYNVGVAIETLDSYKKQFRVFAFSLDASIADKFLKALADEDEAAVKEMIEDTTDPWTKSVMIDLQTLNTGSEVNIL